MEARHIIIIEIGQLCDGIAARWPRERRRCPAWCSSAVFTEWCRSFGALPSRTRDSGRDYCPAGCEVRRQVLQEESSPRITRSEEHTSELQSLMLNSYAVF